MRTIANNPYKLDRNSRWMQYIYHAINNSPFIPSNDRYNLTVSHEKKFVWFRVAKVGTRSILYHFKKLGISLDVEQASHVYYPFRLYNDYYKFAFVRNPWARLVSCWKDKVVNHNHFGFDHVTYNKMKTFEKFVDYVSEQNVYSCERHLCLQSALIDLNNLNYLGRLETFDKDIMNIFNHIAINECEIKPRNVSNNKKPYKDFYNSELENKVAKIYEKDIRLFGYEF